MATVNNKKTSEIDTSEENATGPSLPFGGVDSTADIKVKLAKKLGFKGDGSASPFVSRPLAGFEKLKKVQQKARFLKEKP